MKEKKAPKKRVLKQVIVSRAILIAVALILQVVVMFIAVFLLNEYATVVYVIGILIGLFAVLYIINDRSNPAYKIAWIIPILVLPFFGGLFYLFFGGNRLSKKLRRSMKKIDHRTKKAFTYTTKLVPEIQQKCDDAGNQMRYIEKYSHYPAYRNEYAEYLSDGTHYFNRLKEELKKAERYIFLEYFIITEGRMWENVFNILKEKVKEGVEVRLIYDDAGCITTLPVGYHKKIEEAGIQCRVFNPMVPVLTLRHNNRDHRKIVVIDGKTAFTGGINLADEYIHEFDRFGDWKDAAILIHGASVFSFVVMFLTIWDYLQGRDSDLNAFLPVYTERDEVRCIDYDGYVQPYADSPLDNEPIGETIYFNLINKAKEYIYITTPYLVVSNEMIVALCNAAKCGVDVRIILPGIPDKPAVHAVSRSYYNILVESGVKIFEYKEGFIHAKLFIVDDEYATVGTINMDYRSFYLHFECGVFLYEAGCIGAIRADFETLLERCRRAGAHDYEGKTWYKTLFRSVLRIFAPLM